MVQLRRGHKGHPAEVYLRDRTQSWPSNDRRRKTRRTKNILKPELYFSKLLQTIPMKIMSTRSSAQVFSHHQFLGSQQQNDTNHMSHSENLQSLPMSYHFGYAKVYAMLTFVEFFLTRNKLRKPLRKVLTRPYASEGFAYAKQVMTRPLLKM